MPDWLKRLLGLRPRENPAGEPMPPVRTDDEEEAWNRWYAHKSSLMAQSLGKEHDVVMHAIVSYAVGGALDLYYYQPEGMPGTAIATKELSELPDRGSSNRLYASYELVMFTRHGFSQEEARDPATAFGRAHASINGILNAIARYSAEASLNPRETCEFPNDFQGIGGKCLVFDGYASHTDQLADHFGLLLIMEVFRSEMEFAREYGAAELFERLKARGYYPYSDLDREPVA